MDIEWNLNGPRMSIPKPRCTAAIKRDFLHTGIPDKGEAQLSPFAATMKEMLNAYVCSMTDRCVNSLPGMNVRCPHLLLEVCRGGPVRQSNTNSNF